MAKGIIQPKKSREIEELSTEEEAQEEEAVVGSAAGSAAGIGYSTRGQSSSKVGEGKQVTAV